MIVAEKITSNVISMPVSEVSVDVTDDDRTCGGNMTFCDKHLHCELLPDGVSKDQMPPGICAEDIRSGKVKLDDSDGEGLCGVDMVWDEMRRECVPKETMESGIKKICSICGGVMKNAL